MEIQKSLVEIQGAMNRGAFSMAAKESASILEAILRNFIRDNLTSLDYNARSRISEYEKKRSKGIEQFGLRGNHWSVARN